MSNSRIASAPLGDPAIKLSFRDELRAARATLLRDGERYEDVILVLERLGCLLRSEGGGLGASASVIETVSARSPLSGAVPARHPAWHAPFAHVFDLVRLARNQAVHEGAYARHLGAHAAEIAVVLEDALMSDCSSVADFMVRGPVTAEVWEPLSYVRQKMLLNAYSFLPVRIENGEGSGWRLVSDRGLASYLRPVVGGGERNTRLCESLGEATDGSGLTLEDVECVPPDARVDKVATHLDHRPVLVCDPADPDRLLGIVTAFDLL